MKRTHLLLTGALASVAGAVALAGMQVAGASARASHGTAVQVRHTTLGPILTTAAGRTVYEFTKDRDGRDSCVRIQGCAAVWPVLQTAGRPVAGRGVKRSLLSSIALSRRARQVTYAGHPLYTYKYERPGQTSYVGVRAFGGRWDALNAAGHPVG